MPEQASRATGYRGQTKETAGDNNPPISLSPNPVDDALKLTPQDII
jgi:hypothetical protein